MYSATSSTVYDLCWSDISTLAAAAPIITALALGQHQPLRAHGSGAQNKFGGIAAVARVSAGMCVVTTDTPVVFQEALASSPFSATLHENHASDFLLRIRDASSPDSSSASSQLVVGRGSPPESDLIVDLTSLRVTAPSSSLSSLQIIHRPEVCVDRARLDDWLYPPHDWTLPCLFTVCTLAS